ncbi:MAG: yhaO 2, partial [Planctomycetaceae bacterium]|nr:yhaO 2 [Planctomycetaceae bacterium]
MPLEPFRFLHAANLYLDHQLRGVGRIPESLRETVEQATLTAWDRIVDAAIARQVDFVLLAGNSFDATDHSLTGQVALVAGLERLGAHDIPAFIVPGVADPDMAWRLGLPLPDNVTRFGGELSEPVVLSRGGRKFCTIHHVMANLRDIDSSDGNGLDELAVFAPQFGPNDAGPFDIALLESIANNAALPPELADSEYVAVQEALRGRQPHIVRPDFDPELVARCPIEYWALGEGLKRQAWRVGRGLAHTPGTSQGLSATDTGVLGCTLVEVESDARVRESFIPTSRVRWENVSLTLHTQSTRDAALSQLRMALDNLQRTSNEELWLATLSITGSGRLYQDLQDSDTCQRLWNDAVQNVLSNTIDVVLRRVRYLNPADEQPGTDFLSQEFVRQLQIWGASPEDLGEQALAASPFADGPWAGRFKAVLP